MKISQTPSFCGKLVNEPKVEGIDHLCTPTVVNEMEAAPEGTFLHFKQGYLRKWCRAEFSIPTSTQKSLIYGPKAILKEQDILTLIAKGVKRAKRALKKA